MTTLWRHSNRNIILNGTDATKGISGSIKASVALVHNIDRSVLSLSVLRLHSGQSRPISLHLSIAVSLNCRTGFCARVLLSFPTTTLLRLLLLPEQVVYCESERIVEYRVFCCRVRNCLHIRKQLGYQPR